MRSSAVSDGSGRETTQSATFTLPGGAAAATRTVEWDITRNLPKSSTLAMADLNTSAAVALTTSYGFDEADKLTSMKGGVWGTGGVTVSYNTTGTASKVGDVIALPFGPSSTVTTTTRNFKYTKAGRLATGTVGSRVIRYTWNAFGSGDLEKVVDNGVTTTFAYAEGRLKGVKTGAGATATVTFDAAGRRTLESSGTSGTAAFVRTGYQWVGADLLRGWSRKTGVNPSMTAEYEYDSEGQRTTATVNAPSAWSKSSVLTTYSYGWEGLSLCWIEASSTAITARLTYLFDETERPYAASYEATRSGVATSAVFRLMTTDHGDVVGLASAGGQVFARYQYGPFGEAESATSTAVAGVSAALAAEIADFQPLRYAGYDYDSWSGQYYLQARYYDPVTKQFVSKDAAEADGEESAYQYCSGDPVQMADPTGMVASWGDSGSVTTMDAAAGAYRHARSVRLRRLFLKRAAMEARRDRARRARHNQLVRERRKREAAERRLLAQRRKQANARLARKEAQAAKAVGAKTATAGYSAPEPNSLSVMKERLSTEAHVLAELETKAPTATMTLAVATGIHLYAGTAMIWGALVVAGGGVAAAPVTAGGSVVLEGPAAALAIGGVHMLAIGAGLGYATYKAGQRELGW